MAIGKAVQFRGISNVLKAYTNNKVAPWAIYQGNQFLMKYEGDDLDEGADVLRDYLSMIDQRSSDTVTYTLCVFENPANGKINSGTKYDASFNFRLVDNIEDHQNSRIAGVYEAKIAGLEKQLADLSEPEELSPREKLFEAMGKILEHPHVQQMIATKVVSLVDGLSDTIGGIFKKPFPASYPAAIGSVPVDVNQENKNLQEAVQILITVDDQLGTHLLQLAAVAKKDPAKYKQLIGMLNLL